MSERSRRSDVIGGISGGRDVVVIDMTESAKIDRAHAFGTARCGKRSTKIKDHIKGSNLSATEINHEQSSKNKKGDNTSPFNLPCVLQCKNVYL